jgi:hypothetical protein
LGQFVDLQIHVKGLYGGFFGKCLGLEDMLGEFDVVLDQGLGSKEHPGKISGDFLRRIFRIRVRIVVDLVVDVQVRRNRVNERVWQ